MTARAGFYQDAEHRSYPLVETAPPPLPQDALVDFGCEIGPAAGFLYDEHIVYLDRVTLTGSILSFEFKSDCPGLSGRLLTFSRETSGESEFATEFAESDGGGCPGAALWDGYLVTGRMADLASAVMTAGGVLELGTAFGKVEPGLVQVASSSGVTGVSLANREPPQVADPCQSLSSLGPRRTFVWSACLTGDLKLVEGYNLSVRVSRPENSITIGGAKGGGAGEPCSDVPIAPGEDPLPRVHCTDVIRTFNGLPARRIQLVGGLGVHVVPGPDQHEITVQVDLRGVGGPPTP